MSLDWKALPIALELTDVLWHPDGDAFTARSDVHEVRIARKRKRVTIETALVRPAPFERVAAYAQQRGKGRVLAGFPGFDREVWVEATDWNVEGTGHVLASRPVREGMRALITAGGSATPRRLTVVLDAPERDAITSALRSLVGLAAALALLSHERKERPARPMRRTASRIDESSETAVDEWAKDRFRIHNPRLTPATLELDLRAHTLQVPPAAPFRLGSALFVRPGMDASTLERRVSADGQPAVICRGRHTSIESLADALARLGVEVLA